MVLGASFVLLGKVAGAAKEMAVAWRYGISTIVDGYLYVMSLVSWPVAVWFGVLGVVLVPLAASTRRNTPHELPRFRAELLGLTLLIGLTLLAIAEFGLPPFLRSSLSGLSGTALAHALEAAPILSGVILLGFVISVMSVWTTAGERHSNTLQESIPALVILIAVLAWDSSTAAPLIFGTLAGYALHLAALAWTHARRGELERPRFAFSSTAWRGFWSGFAVMLAGQVILSLITIIDQFFAARLGAGAISTLGYANRIIALILGLGATVASRASLPVFSRGEAEGATHVRRMALQWSALLFGIGAAAVAIGWFAAPWIVRLLFERGAFTAADTAAVAGLLRFGLFQVPFYFASLVLVSLASSRTDYLVLFFSAAISLTVKVIGNLILVPRIGLNGLVLVNGLVYGSSAVFLYAVTRRPREAR